MTSVIDQKAYLQKYLTGVSADKKKKKKKNVKGKGFKIIDDDLDLSKLRPLDGDELDILNEGEDGPQIAGIIDERPEELRSLDAFKSSSKWRVINQDDGFNSKLRVEEVKRDIKQMEKENELVFGKMYSDSEDEKKDDSDASPPRKSDSTKGLQSKKNTRHSDSDISPPRKDTRNAKNRNYESDASPPRKKSSKNKQSNHSDSYVSPPRRKRDIENTKSKNKNPHSDGSPVNKRSKNSSSNNRKARMTDNDSDASPPRRKDNNKANNRVRKPTRWGNFEDEITKSRRRSESPKSSNKTESRITKNVNQNKGYDSDVSPPRKSRRVSPKRDKSSDSDISPPRKRRHSKDGSPPQKHKQKVSKQSKRRHESDSDMSPPRKERSRNNDRKRSNANRSKREDSDSDLSPPRKERNRNYQERRDRGSNDEPPPTNKRMERTLDGKKAGLQDAEQLKQENEAFRRREDAVFKNMTDEMSGRNAQIVSRKGKRETSEDRQKQKEKADRQRALDEKYKKWSKGLKQIESQQMAVEDFIHESSKPLARYKDDRDLETKLKDVERQGDPMLQYIRERKREKGELAPEKPMYKGNFPPNRFNIRPGYRWDGVDRSNGYEKKYFEQQSKKKAQQEEVYKWSTEDL